jgi:predicted AAA+ superfamily ATPase
MKIHDNSWHSNGGLWQDPDLSKIKSSSLRYQPQVFQFSELQQDTLWTLRGPRRSGKTVSLKLIISELIEKQICKPEKVIWTSADNIRNTEKLDDHLRALIAKNQPDFLFCDEITAVVGWQLVLKKMRDQGMLSKTCTVLTGSSAYDLKKGSERLAGRKGVFQSTDRVLLPMTFQQFQSQHGNLNIEDYLTCGGFPFRVDELVKKKLIGERFDPHFGLSVFEDVYFYEFGRKKLDRNIALDILGRLSQVQPHAISYTGFSKALNIKPDTAKKYLDLLGDAYLLGTIFSYDTSRSRVAIKKDRKFIWIDPAFTFLAQHLAQGESSSSASRAEQLVGVQLLRQKEIRLYEGLSAPRQIFTWKSKNGNEIDYLYVNKSEKTLFPVEVKYQNSISAGDLMQLDKAFHKGIVVTKNAVENQVVNQNVQVNSLEKFMSFT